MQESGSGRLVLQSVCKAAASAPSALILDHKLPPLLVARDSSTSTLPDNLQTLLNQLSPLMGTEEKCVQVSAFLILDK